MSELAPGSLSLDETYESQIPEPETPPEPQPAAETPPPAQDDPEPEGTVEIPTGKVVPLAALQGERQAKRDAETARQKAEAEANDLRQKLGVIQNEWQQVQPLIQQLRSQPPPKQDTPAPKGPLTDQEAAEYARDLDLYKSDGTPDVDRAQRLAARQAAISQKHAQAAVQPLQELTDQQRSAYYYNHYAGLKDKAGQPVVDPQILRETWSVAPANMAANPDIAQTLFMNAVGRSVLEGKYRGFVQQAPPPPPPVGHTESLGGGIPGKSEPSAFERRAMEAANMSQKDFSEIASRYKPGERNSLE